MTTKVQHQESPEAGDLLGQIGEQAQQSTIELGSEEKNTHRLIVDVAKKLFRQLGLQRTTVADIARELNMSPANVYRFFAAKSEINAAVCRDILGRIETEAEKIALGRGSAPQRLQGLFASVERSHYNRYLSDRKLHELVEVAISENWSIMNEHNQRMAAILEQVIASGMAAGEFRQGDAAVAARLVNAACIRFCHPRLIAEYDLAREVTFDRMVEFCLVALTRYVSSDQDRRAAPETTEEERGAALWDKAFASLSRSARVMEELAESTGETIAHINARGDRIDRIQKETRALLDALVAPEVNT